MGGLAPPASASPTQRSAPEPHPVNDGSPRTCTPCPRGHRSLSRRRRLAPPVDDPDPDARSRTAPCLLMREAPSLDGRRGMPTPGVAPGPSPYQGGAPLLELRGRERLTSRVVNGLDRALPAQAASRARRARRESNACAGSARPAEVGSDWPVRESHPRLLDVNELSFC